MSDEEEEEWEYEEEEEEERAPRRPKKVAEGDDPLKRSLALGYLAMAPLFLAYEMALATSSGNRRNTSELVLFRIFALFGEWADVARRSALVIGIVLALVYCLRKHFALGPRILRIVCEGALGAIVLGPLLVGLLRLFGDWLPAIELSGAPSQVPGLERAALVTGAGAYEELVFRVGAYSIMFLACRSLAGFFGAAGRAAHWVGEVGGLIGSAALFSAFHLALFVAWLGPGGESFEPAVFTYRFLAGILLGVLFRWRGPGVAGWTHGLFNLALLLGAGPDVFL